MGVYRVFTDRLTGQKILSVGDYNFEKQCDLETGETKWSCSFETCKAFAKTLGAEEEHCTLIGES
ncbi:unnamed protein product, partial [Nesidiocoris tenuis]